MDFYPEVLSFLGSVQARPCPGREFRLSVFLTTWVFPCDMSILGFAVYLESSLKFQGIFNHDGLHYLALSPLTNQFSYLVIWAHHLCPLVYCHSFSYALLWQWYFGVLLLTSFRIKSSGLVLREFLTFLALSLLIS